MYLHQVLIMAILIIYVAIPVRSLLKDQQQATAPKQQLLKTEQVEVRPETPSLFSFPNDKPKPALRDRFKVTITDSRTSLSRVESLNTLMEQMSIAILKPITIINVLREFILSISSLIMSASAASGAGRISTSRNRRDWKTRYGLIPHRSARLSRSTSHL